MCVEARGQHWVLFFTSHTPCFGSWGSLIRLGWMARDPLGFCLPRTGINSACHHTQLLLWKLWIALSHHTCMASTLPNLPTPYGDHFKIISGTHWDSSYFIYATLGHVREILCVLTMLAHVMTYASVSRVYISGDDRKCWMDGCTRSPECHAVLTC